jgi:23S rRNA (uracil1939-C5)-methyltransferase
MPNSCSALCVAERLVIERLGHRGDGVAATTEGVVYVPYALPGETVAVASGPDRPDRRILVGVERASADRVPPLCPHFGTCGGCAVQHWAAEPYRAWKRDLVAAALTQAGVPAAVDDLVDAHGEGRRRVVLHARRGQHDVLQVGFAAPRAHHIVAIDRCPVLAPGLAGAIKGAWALTAALQPLRKPLDIHVTATEAGLDVDLRGSGALSPGQHAALVRTATAQHLARLTRHGELVMQSGVPTVRMGQAEVRLPAAAFLQATAEGEATLARLVLAHVGDADEVLDLFAGIGPFALRLAQRAHVTAADHDNAAIEALTRAAQAARGLKPVAGQVRDLFRRPFTAAELNAFAAAVFDPPRQGAEAQARQLAGSRVPIVVAVSCNAATFARDARILADGGYRLAQVTPVDQFRYSAHVELVARFER